MNDDTIVMPQPLKARVASTTPKSEEESTTLIRRHVVVVRGGTNHIAVETQKAASTEADLQNKQGKAVSSPALSPLPL